MVVHNVDKLFEESLAKSELSAKQKAVLRASLDLFATQGFDRTSTRDIAQAAGVSEGTVYKRFKTKDAILQALLAPFVDEIIPQIAGEFVDNTMTKVPAEFETLLHTILLDRFHYVMDNYRVVKIIASEVLQRPDLARQVTDRVRQLFVERFFPVIEHYQRAGQLVTWPPLQVISMIAGTMLSQGVMIFITNQPHPDVATMVDQCVQFLMKGLSPQPLEK
ncbi:MAG: TetR/AcrR family transcriptional regulator [Lactobacillus sp.]|jgi:AcrR family transcriptional regulator|uniref:TetR/AcrR family transcriptional regulator n=1 Tax=Lacticaseibacillus suilingensis TaxID=2799577 RepID=A0ABW4BCF5_9LACO|nr:TetR/AcrR family transcriptional regulator [Lacticaseibacillus suilingensis]MCI1893174.1 TetR/AcrR family transcriptional regulator [Lactobacillus sp.]MCI1918405.1 TetR/AcrR family transcriptional regulator [Lactobacillus sp.]MCI1940876.1 TetR/AcrR family transcriptional regulator [Lactobacillus sp.]MCI1971255.1 TetR/AcrR family transcriptional regulator [Lactobacillus sp.]